MELMLGVKEFFIVLINEFIKNEKYKYNQMFFQDQLLFWIDFYLDSSPIHNPRKQKVVKTFNGN